MHFNSHKYDNNHFLTQSNKYYTTDYATACKKGNQSISKAELIHFQGRQTRCELITKTYLYYFDPLNPTFIQ